MKDPNLHSEIMSARWNWERDNPGKGPKYLILDVSTYYKALAENSFSLPSMGPEPPKWYGMTVAIVQSYATKFLEVGG